MNLARIAVFSVVASLFSIYAWADTRHAPRHAPRHAHGTLGVDLGFLVTPQMLPGLYERRVIPRTEGSSKLEEIIHVGSRVLTLVDNLQKNVPPQQREQIWRRVDRIGNEASPFRPSVYNEAIVVGQYNDLIQPAPRALIDLLRSNEPLPEQLPAGIAFLDFMKFARAIHNVYSRTSRWMVLSGYKNSMPKSTRDFRGWLFLAVQKDAIFDLLEGWEDSQKSERERLVQEISKACPLVFHKSIKDCEREYAQFINPKSGPKAKEALQEILVRGKRIYDRKFVVQIPHEGVETRKKGSLHEVMLPTYDIADEMVSWIQERLDEAFQFYGAFRVVLEPFARYRDGALQVIWSPGALPNVNGIGGDTITMDSNIPRWLEVTQIVMRHELGHVLGFPDCYTEFWDEDKQAIVYYVLDPADRMCALSGGPMSRHRDTLIQAYF